MILIPWLEVELGWGLSWAGVPRLSLPFLSALSCHPGELPPGTHIAIGDSPISGTFTHQGRGREGGNRQGCQR